MIRHVVGAIAVLAGLWGPVSQAQVNAVSNEYGPSTVPGFTIRDVVPVEGDLFYLVDNKWVVTVNTLPSILPYVPITDAVNYELVCDILCIDKDGFVIGINPIFFAVLEAYNKGVVRDGYKDY